MDLALLAPDAGGWGSILAGIELGRVTLSGIGAMAILGLLTGRLITLREHRETRADRDVWRESSLSKDSIITTLTHQLDVASRGSELGLAVMEKIDQAVEKKMKGDAP